jgi:hypothetical protein
MKVAAFVFIAAGIGLVMWQSGMFAGTIARLPKTQEQIEEAKQQKVYELLRGRCRYTQANYTGCEAQAYERAFGHPYEG